MGVSVAVLVRVGVALGLGVIVQVGLGVVVAVIVAVWVWLGVTGRLSVGVAAAKGAQPAIPHANRSRMITIFSKGLAWDGVRWRDIKE